jgi:hypothetical protein
MSPIKEPHFFAAGYEKVGRAGFLVPARIAREREYIQLFEEAGEAKAIGEASPSYLYDEGAPYLIKERIPKAKIIISLRDPIERAHSLYLHLVRAGVETRPFYDALFGELGELYVRPGQYADQVRRYLEVFGRDHVLVVMFEDLKQNPVELLCGVADFLGVDRELAKCISVDTAYNPYRAPKNRFARFILNVTPWLRYSIKDPLKTAIMRSLPVVRRVKRFIYRTFLWKETTKPAIDRVAVEYLKTIYEKEVAGLEELLGRPLPDLRKVW